MIRHWMNPAECAKPSHEVRSSDGPCRIIVYDDQKVRVFRHKSTLQDEWSVLYRRDVPNLTDDEWFASPGDDWTEVKPE